RTWEFQTAGVVGPTLQVTPRRIGVAQKSVYVSFSVRNTSAAPAVIEARTFTLRLPDGTTIDGHISVLGRGFEQARGVLGWAGISSARRSAVPPGAPAAAPLTFRHYGRDLRRHPTLTVALDGLLVDGKPSGLPPLVLAAPPGAPIGEDI